MPDRLLGAANGVSLFILSAVMCILRPWQLSWSLEIPAGISEESLPFSRAEIIRLSPQHKIQIGIFPGLH